MRYILRTCVDKNNPDEYLRDLLAACRAGKIDEVMLCEDSFYVAATPQPLEKHKKCAELLKRAADFLKANGLKCSFFLKSLLGHFSGTACVLPYAKFVGINGYESSNELCMLDERVADYAAEVMKCYASCGFEAMMFDDDFRSVNHGGGQFGCFCDLHVQKTAERYGKPLTRADLIAAFNSYDEQSKKIKKCFREVTYNAQLSLVKKVERAVHSVDKNVQLGLMVSGVNADQFQGRNINELLRAFAGEGKVPFVRPPGGAYSESLGHGLLFGLHEGLKYRAVLQEPIRYVSEIDTYAPRNIFTKSVRVFDLQCRIHAITGYEELTLNIIDHYGTMPSESVEYLKMLAQNKQEYAELVELVRGKTPRGISVVTPQNYVQNLNGERYGKDGTSYAEAYFNRLGLPVCFAEGEVNYLNGEITDCYTDDELSALLKRGAILDQVAVCSALKRGFSEYIGITSAEKVSAPCFERLTSAEENCGYRLKYPVYTANSLSNECVYKMSPLSGATVLTELVNADGESFGACSAYYENKFGGRIFATGSAFNADTLFHKGRRAQFHSVACKLYKNIPFGVQNAVSVAPVWYEGENESVLILYNFGQDEQSFDLRLLDKTQAVTMPPLSFKIFKF